MKNCMYILNPKGLSNIKPIENSKVKGIIGELPDGKRINVRTSSEDGRPTLEIFNPKME
jgi:hypothetical protein